VALPSIANLAVIPLVGAVDTFWIGRMGDALALAGQGAANQCFFSIYFLIAFIPTITAPLVAKAAGSGDTGAACDRVCEALFLANVLGAIGTLILVLRPSLILNLVLPAGAPAAAYAANYLRLRSLSLIPALISAVGFAAFRGMLDTVTPLKVSLASNVLNLVLDPLLIFGARMGVAGAALATAASEAGAGAIYVGLLLKRKMLRLGRLLEPPKLSALLPLLRGGSAMLLRQAALNVAFVSATRMTQAMDSTGVAAAVYSITNTIYSLGLVVMLAIQATGATLVPSALAVGGEEGTLQEGTDRARRVADRLIGWSTCIAAVMAAAQALAIPFVVPLFSTLPEVRSAVAKPAMVSALVQLTNGPLFAGEGILMGVGGFGFLAGLTSLGVAVMVSGLTLSSRLGLGVSSVWYSLLAFHAVQLTGVLLHHLRIGPLARRVTADGTATLVEPSNPPLGVECVELPVVGEVCVTDADPSTQEG
jgi:putative MATE family efflux protein